MVGFFQQDWPIVAVHDLRLAVGTAFERCTDFVCCANWPLSYRVATLKFSRLALGHFGAEI